MLYVPDAQWVLALPEREQLAWYIALGEAHGGEWDYDKNRWLESPKPRAVFAVPAEMGDSSREVE